VTKIADLETEIAQLKGQTQADQGLRAQVAAKDQALGAKLGLDEQDMGRIPVQAWGLAYAEYFRSLTGTPTGGRWRIAET
jgi:hypothetical protein